jgi:hypothetical protein
MPTETTNPRNKTNCYRPSVINGPKIPVIAADIGWSKNRVIDWCVTRGLAQLQKRIKKQTTAKQTA